MFAGKNTHHLEKVHSSQNKVSVNVLISHGPSSNSYWASWAYYASKIPPTEIDFKKVVAAGPAASLLTRFLGHIDCEWQLTSDRFGKWVHGSGEVEEQPAAAGTHTLAHRSWEELSWNFPRVTRFLSNFINMLKDLLFPFSFSLSGNSWVQKSVFPALMQTCCHLAIVLQSQAVGCSNWPTWRDNVMLVCFWDGCGYFSLYLLNVFILRPC